MNLLSGVFVGVVLLSDESAAQESVVLGLIGRSSSSDSSEVEASSYEGKVISLSNSLTLASANDSDKWDEGNESNKKGEVAVGLIELEARSICECGSVGEPSEVGDMLSLC